MAAIRVGSGLLRWPAHWVLRDDSRARSPSVHRDGTRRWREFHLRRAWNRRSLYDSGIERSKSEMTDSGTAELPSTTLFQFPKLTIDETKVMDESWIEAAAKSTTCRVPAMCVLAHVSSVLHRQSAHLPHQALSDAYLVLYTSRSADICFATTIGNA